MSAVVSDLLDSKSLRYLWTPDLDSLFSCEGRVGVPSAWYGHVPFAHWIVGAVKPRTIVELGTHYGVSYCAFCQAIVDHGFDARCYAVDTWKGDDQAGHYGEEVYADLRAFQDERYGAFSELLRCTFDRALPFFAEGSVDLLHLDGLHTFEAVAHDFRQWRSKLSESAVVLFHDTNVKEGEFGVWRLWEELRTQFPTFEFLHEHGLGILAPGGSIPPTVLELFSLRDPVKVAAVRQRFAFLGQRWQLLAQRELQYQGAIEAETLRLSAAQAQFGAFEARIQSLEKEAEARLAELETLRQGRTAALARTGALETRLQSLESEALIRQRRLAELETQSAAQGQLRANAALRSRLMRAELASARAQGVRAPVPAKTTGGASAHPLVLFISAEPETPGNIYRVVRQVEALRAAGAPSSWISVQEVAARHEEIAKADVLVLWRVAWDEQVASAVKTARRRGARVIFDVDDLMINPAFARIEVIDGIRTTNLTESQVSEHYKRVQSTMLAADYCSAPTEELAGEIRQFSQATMVLPNGFDHAAYKASRRAVRRRRCSPSAESLVRIGYAGGSRTHQRDFAVAAPAVARVLRERPHCRLVLFRSAQGTVPFLDLEEFADFQGLEERIEWQDFVPLSQLPEKLALFDINLAPLETGNVFCEAKSELKFFEAALVDVPTIASPTGPFRRAIRDGVTGFLADNSQAWYSALLRLVDDQGFRFRIARAAQRDVLWHYGPRRRADAMISALSQWRGHSQDATRAFALDLFRTKTSAPFPIPIAESEVVFESDKLGDADLTVLIPLYNYAHYIEEALESVRAQSLEILDLVVVDDASCDASLAAVLAWAGRHAQRFNRLLVLRNKANSGLGTTRNTGIDAADTPYVLQLDADNRLLPDCAAICLSAICESGAAFAYPPLQQFGDGSALMGICPFEPGRLIGGNYIDALALVSKEAWVAVGGYKAFRIMGWEDYDFWCRLVEKGLWGCRAGEIPLAHYRVHSQSMLRTITTAQENTPRLIREMKERHPWLNIVGQANAARTVETVALLAPSRLQGFLPVLRCPETGQGLEIGPGGTLQNLNGSRAWPLVQGRPNLFPGLQTPGIFPDSHLSNALPQSALGVIAEAGDGLVLNLSAGGTAQQFNNVLEAEAAVFRHTDILVDAHRLPFADGAFAAILVMNAFEHYREPKRVAGELFRVLRPGGKILVHTAFLQPLHEKPWHFYNCTRYGLEEWFKDFETERLHVSHNFSPGHSISWLASECELALRRHFSTKLADAFTNASLGHLSSLWRGTAETRSADSLWSALAQLPQEAQEGIAAGFEYLGRRPHD
jgi:glycosyltransferase involved in cell wall biosynthesis/SAM-dependent methyltransferase